MSCESVIKRYYHSLPPGTLFTTREVLGRGYERNTVDQTLVRLVNGGQIKRIVRGMFVDASTARTEYSDLEVATKKATSFGKEIRQHSADSAQNLGLPVEKNKRVTYLINGCSSQFHLWETGKRIVFRTASAKKMRVPDTHAGKAVRGLWHLGKKGITGDLFFRVAATLRMEDCIVIKGAGAWMPWWLSNIFVRYFRARPKLMLQT